MSSSVSYECLHDFIYPKDLQVRQIDEDVHIALVNHAYPEWQANARLIAHAPEMYKVLQVFADEPSEAEERVDELCVAYFQAREILARIDGEEDITNG